MKKAVKMMWCGTVALLFAFPVMGIAAGKNTNDDKQSWEFIPSGSPYSVELAGIEVDPYTGNTLTDEC